MKLLDLIVYGAMILLLPAALSFIFAFNEVFKAGLANWLLR